MKFAIVLLLAVNRLKYRIGNDFSDLCSRFRTIPLWCQKSSEQKDGLVAWDYHVIFIAKHADEKFYVYDLDT